LVVLESVADELGATPNQVVLAWMVQSDSPVIPLVAASREEQLDENLGAADLRLDQ
jgi:aryl-alcohol dehydrogenase-like predicted oxidoreductase